MSQGVWVQTLASITYQLCTLGSFTSCASVSSSIKMRLPHGLLESTKYPWSEAWYIVRAQLSVTCYKFLEVCISISHFPTLHELVGFTLLATLAHVCFSVTEWPGKRIVSDCRQQLASVNQSH